MTGINGLNAPNEGVRVSCKEASDVYLHANNLTNWQQVYDQTSRGSFYGRIVELPFSDLQVFKETTGQALQQSCNVWPDSVWLGIPLSKQRECRINGLPIGEHNIMCRPGNCEFELTTPQDYDLYGMVVELQTLMQTAQVHGVDLNYTELEAYGRLSLPESVLSNVRFLLARSLGEQSGNVCTNRISHDLLMMVLLEVLQTETPEPVATQSYQHRKVVVDQARSFIRSRTDTPVTVTDLCQVTNVSRRTLQYAFESILDMSPIQYLRLSRLNGVRRALLLDDSAKTVADIAAHWGFWHMSQFAKDYRLLFVERPSETRSYAMFSRRLTMYEA